VCRTVAGAAVRAPGGIEVQSKLYIQAPGDSEEDFGSSTFLP